MLLSLERSLAQPSPQVVLRVKKSPEKTEEREKIFVCLRSCWSRSASFHGQSLLTQLSFRQGQPSLNNTRNSSRNSFLANKYLRALKKQQNHSFPPPFPLPKTQRLWRTFMGILLACLIPARTCPRISYKLVFGNRL